MWKDYSKSYIKNNRASSISVMAAALIAALFLSLLCSTYYNSWVYEIERIHLDEGTWQGRISGNLDEKDLELIQNFHNVEKAVINEALSDDETVVDIYFQNAITIYKEMPIITAKLGLPEEAAQYHSLLLSRYFIHDPKDNTPPMLMGFYMGILIVISVSLVLVIRNSFEISMNARLHQFGIFSSIGATPKQIKTCLLHEAAALCTVPILAGNLIGIGISFIVLEAVNYFAANVAGRHQAVFHYHPLVFVMTLLLAVLTVLFSVWLPARKLSKMSPLTAIRDSENLYMQKAKHSRVLSCLFGIEGELAGNALKAQKKTLRIATVSLLLSFLGFTAMLCFFTLSEISTRYTYFERHQNAWDVMITVKNTGLREFNLIDVVKQIPGVVDGIVYQKVETDSLISEDWQSERLVALGGLDAATGGSVIKEGDYFRVASPIVVIDDESFLAYCLQIGVTPSLQGTIILNHIWDSTNSNFRDKKYIPFVKENRDTTILYGDNGTSFEIPILSYTQEAPVLREEYDNNTLVHFIPLSVWKNRPYQSNEKEQTTYIRILTGEEPSLDALSRLENKVVNLVGKDYNIESENRVQEKISSAEVMKGSKALLGGFCGLLAMIGIANVFSYTLSFLRLRKLEFAQYLSIGLTPAEMKKMFCIEALVIAGRPLLITLPLTAAVVAFMIKASYLEPAVFLKEAPINPILIFALLIFGFVALAYYIGGKRILTCNLNETLKKDTIV